MNFVCSLRAVSVVDRGTGRCARLPCQNNCTHSAPNFPMPNHPFEWWHPVRVTQHFSRLFFFRPICVISIYWIFGRQNRNRHLSFHLDGFCFLSFSSAFGVGHHSLRVARPQPIAEKIRFVPKPKSVFFERSHAKHRTESIFEIVAILGIQKKRKRNNMICVRFCWFADCL